MKQPQVKQEKNMKNVIDGLGLKQSWVAEKAGITAMELSHIIAGRRKTNAYAKKETKVWTVLNEVQEARA